MNQFSSAENCTLVYTDYAVTDTDHGLYDVFILKYIQYAACHIQYSQAMNNDKIIIKRYITL